MDGLANQAEWSWAQWFPLLDDAKLRYRIEVDIGQILKKHEGQ